LRFTASLIVALVLSTLPAANALAEIETVHVLSVHDLIHMEIENEGDGAKILVNGYLAMTTSIHLFPTRDHALIFDHISSVFVSDAGDGDIATRCLDTYVEILGHIKFHEPRVITLSPSKVTILTPNDSGPPDRKECWAAEE
jgi:hypothetical protein